MFKAALALSVALVSSSAFATTLPIGGDVTPNGVLNPSGTLLAATGNEYVTAATFSGLYTENVIADQSNPLCSGCLDFVIQVANQSPSGTTPTQVIERVTTSNFDSYMISASYVPSATGVAPNDATRSATGGVISFDFLLTPGQVSDGLVIYTNALNYTTGVLSLQDGSAVTGPLAFEPTGPQYSPVPEPSSLMLLGTGLVGVAGVGRRKLAGLVKK